MIGDVLTSSILFEAIKHQYPKAQLHYLINTHTFPVVQGHPHIDKFHFFTQEHEHSFVKLFQFALSLRRESFDVVIDVYSKLSSNLVTLLSAANLKISKFKWYTAFIYSHTFKEQTIARTNAGLAIENRLQLLKPLGIELQTKLKPKIFLSEIEKNNARTFLAQNGIDLKKPMFMIGVLGSGLNKTYPFHYMAKVIDTIVLQSPESQVLFNYIPSQIEQAQSVYNLCSSMTQKNIHFEVFGKSIREFLAITSFCTALIGNEGGAINMAKAIDIPTFAIYSPWISKEAWSVFDDGVNHVSVHLKDIKPELYENVRSKFLKKNANNFYHTFSPDFIWPKLRAFLKNR